MLNKRLLLSLAVISSACFMSACVSQAVTAPVQVASQGAQTTGQAAGQATQAVIPDGNEEAGLNSSDSAYQSGAYSNVTEAADTKKSQRNNL